MKKLLKNKPFVISLTVFVLILGGLIIAWQSALYTLNSMSFKSVTTTQLAADMRQDQFWSSNRFNTLVFDGKVKGKNTVNEITSFSLITSDTYVVSCEFQNQNTDLKVGQSYKFAVETYQAERQPNGVLLHNCILLSS
jgi:hypothetical protein